MMQRGSGEHLFRQSTKRSLSCMCCDRLTPPTNRLPRQTYLEALLRYHERDRATVRWN